MKGWAKKNSYEHHFYELVDDEDQTYVISHESTDTRIQDQKEYKECMAKISTLEKGRKIERISYELRVYEFVYTIRPYLNKLYLKIEQKKVPGSNRLRFNKQLDKIQ